MNATREQLPHLTPVGRQVLADCAQPRISFSRVRRACERTGMRLSAGEFLGTGADSRPDDCGCPLAVLYVACHGYPIARDLTDWLPDTETVDQWTVEALGLAYANGFMAGFDYTACPDAGSYAASPNRGNALYTAGYRDGAAVFHRAQRAGLIKEAA
jgi:hypothetical protein